MNEPKYTDARIEELVEFLRHVPSATECDDAASALESLLSERQAAMQGQGGDVPNELDELRLRFAEVCEERDHLNSLLLGAAMQGQIKVYQCPRCATSMQVDPTAKPASAHRSVSDEDVEWMADQLDVLFAVEDAQEPAFLQDVRKILEAYAAIAQEKQS